MSQADDVVSLRARIEELESQNETLRASADDASAPGGGSRGGAARTRTAFAVVFVLLAALIAPVALLGGWARYELVDTERFVQTFAPLAEKPEVQSFIADQVVTAIDENVDIDGLVRSLFEGIESLDIPPKAAAAVGLLEGPAAQGVRSMIRTSVDGIVTSPQFARLWNGVLRQTHAQAIAVIQGDPDAAIQLSSDGALTLELGTVIASVKQQLLSQGMRFASLIPVVDRSIPILNSDSLLLVRSVYQLSVAAGTWLPWLTLGLLVAGVVVSRRRLRTLAWGGVALALSFLLLASGLGIGKLFFVSTVSPSIMPASTADVVFGQLTELMSSIVTALTMLALLIAVGAWLFGSTRPAVAIRTAGDRGLSKVREASDRAGLDPRGFGRAVDRWRPAILVLAVAGGVLIIFLSRPVTVGAVVGTLVVLLIVLLLVELIRRPARGRTTSVEGEGREAVSQDA